MNVGDKMSSLSPRESIKIRLVNDNEEIKCFDSRVHLVFVLHGEAKVVKDKDSISLSKDDFYILSKGESIIFKRKNGKAFYFDLEYYSEPTDSNFIYTFKGDSQTNPKTSDSELIFHLKQLLIMRLTESESNVKIFNQYFKLLMVIESYYRVEIYNYSDKSIKLQIEEIAYYIENNFERDITLGELARQLYVTEQYLSRIFKEQMGIGISDFLINCRLKKVSQLLSQTDDSITDIAFSSGFSNINSFNRIFKRFYKMTPTEYRENSKSILVVDKRTDDLVDFNEVKDYLTEDEYIPEEKIIKVPKTSEGEFKRPKLMINFGYAGDIISNRFINDVKFANQFTEFEYARIWGLLSNRIMPEVNGLFDFTKIDEIIQNILELGLLPFLDLGFKGKQIHESISKIVSLDPFTLSSNQLDSVLQRYHALMKHLTDRFGSESVSEWVIEIWKPNKNVLEMLKQEELGKLYDGKRMINLTSNHGYFEFFEKVKNTIKNICPQIEIGGSGLSLDLEKKEIQYFLSEWAKETIKPDFLSVSIYPLDLLKDIVLQDDKPIIISSNTDEIRDSLARARHWLEETGLCHQLVVSEFNITISGRDIINDSAFKGPYLLKNILAMKDYCEVVGYWQFSDLPFVTFDVNNKEIFGGCGLISKNGIPKPSFFALEFLSMLKGELIHFEDGVVITQYRSRYYVLIYHYCHLNSLYYYSEQENINKHNIATFLENDGKKRIKLIFDNVESLTDYKINERKVGVKHGAFINELNELSFIDDFSTAEIIYLKLKCIPHLTREIVKSNNEGKLKVEVEVDPHDMVLLAVEI